jgi:hypothetical protein
MPSYYDIVLGLIPLTLAGLTGLFLLGGLSMSLSVPLASTAAIGLIGHAMFVNGPPTAERSTDARARGGHQPSD